MTKYKEVEGIDASTYAGKAALAAKTKARGIMGDELLIFVLLDFVTYMQLNNKFATLGIFVTENNREECYIKIIESGSEDLIKDLERYIELGDNIKRIESQKQEYNQIISKLQLLSDYNDESSVNGIIEDYLRR